MIEKRTPQNTAPHPDMPLCMMCFNPAINMAKETDVFIVSNCKSEKATEEFSKLFGKLPAKQTLKVVYKEPQASKAKFHKLGETIHAFHLGSPHLNEAEPRLHYTLTSTASDHLLLADPAGAGGHRQFSKSVKVSLLGESSLWTKEKELDQHEKVAIVHHEKAVHLFEEVFRPFQVSSACILSGGTSSVLMACVNHDIKALVFARNEAHEQLLRDTLTQHLLEQSSIPTCSFHLSDSDILKNFGLNDDKGDEGAGGMPQGDGIQGGKQGGRAGRQGRPQGEATGGRRGRGGRGGNKRAIDEEEDEEGNEDSEAEEEEEDGEEEEDEREDGGGGGGGGRRAGGSRKMQVQSPPDGQTRSQSES